MTAQHTKLRLVAEDEFWSASHSGLGTSAYQVIKAEDGAVLALAVGHDPDAFADPNLDHARRLVVCWNACEGITTERLEDLGRPLMQHLIGCDERAARMVKERDELLEALQTIVKSLADQDDEGMIEHAEPMIRARAAIQKATKEQA